jgi:endonuclease/exonuclease/phosphatase family metal-dependent hydrolase
MRLWRGWRSSLVAGGLLVAGLAALAGGCGQSETAPAPVVDPNPFAGVPAGTDSTFDVLTWNLRYFPTDGPRTVAAAAQAITAIDPDLVALQEIDSGASFAALVEALPGWEGYRGVTDDFSLRLAYLVKSAVVEMDAGGFSELFAADGRAFPRAPLVAEIRAFARDLVVINNHLKCCGDGDLDADDPWDEETRRRDACAALADHIATVRAGEPVILLGDLNDLLGDPPADNVFQVFLDAPQMYRFADAALAAGPPSGWSYPPSSHLDHILVTAPLFAALDAPAAGVATLRLELQLGGLDSYHDLLSDHRPLLLRLDLR